MVRFPQPEKWLGFYRAAKTKEMENQEEDKTSIEYFYDKVLDASEFYESEYKAIFDALHEAKKMYDIEIEEAKKDAFEKGYEEGVKYTDGLISDERFPF